MEFRILGQLEVVCARGQVVAIPAARHRAVLALLVLHANRLVSRDVLIDHLWSGTPPDGAVGTLQSYVSRLRAALRTGAETGVTLVSGSGGRAYRLDVDAEGIDAVRFERLIGTGCDALAAGAAEDADAAFAAALALWRDQPLADLAGDYGFAQEAARRLTALRVTALEGAFQAAAACGRLPDRVDEVQAAAAEHPGHPGLRELEMLALHQTGRTAEALAVYHEFRNLRVEQGLDPEPALRDLEHRILRQDPGLRPDRPVPGLPGRGAQLARLRAALTAASARSGRLLLLHGEAGIGKSTLAARLAEAAAAAGAVIGVGSPLGGDGATAFRPWIQALGALGDSPARALLEDPGYGGPGYGGPGYGGPGHGDADHGDPGHGDAGHGDPGAPTAVARARQFDAVGDALGAAAADRPVVLLLDDLHDADQPSLRLLEHVARRMHGTRLLILALARDAEGPSTPGTPGTSDMPGTAGTPGEDAWTATLHRLRRIAGVQDLALKPLDDAAVAELVAFELGRPPGADLLDAVTRRARGNPLFAVELTRLLADARVLARLNEDGGRLPGVPPLVREVVRDRAGRLPAATRSLLAQAAVLGFEIDLAILAEAAGLPAGDAQDVLRPAVERRFLEPVRGHAGRLRFTHPLVHEALEDELPIGRRQALHRRAAEAIEVVHGAWTDFHAERLATHWRLAGGPEAQARSLEYALRASHQARAALAWEEAARVLSLALDNVQEPLSPARRCELLIEQGSALRLAGDGVPADRVLLQAVDVARRLGDGRLLARAALMIGESNAFLWTGPDAGAELLETALRMLAASGTDAGGAPELRARLLACLAATLVWASDRDAPENRSRRDRLSAEAVTLARRTGDRAVLTEALRARVGAIWSPGNTAERLGLAAEQLAAAEAAGAREPMLAAVRNRAIALLELGDLDGYRSEVRRHAAGATELRLPVALHWAAIDAATLAMAEGRFADADAAVAQALELGRRLEPAEQGGVQNGVVAQLLMRLRDRGRPDGPLGALGALGATDLSGLERSARTYVRATPATAAWQAGLALLQVIDGRTDEARECYEALVAPGLRLLAPDAAWSCTMVALTELCVHFGDVERAQELRALLLPFADRCAVITFGFALLGSFAHFLGLLSTVLDDVEEADGHFRRALAAHRRMGAPPLIARTQVEHAAVLLRAADRGINGPPGRERATALLAAGGAAARRLGMTPLARRAAALAGTARR